MQARQHPLTRGPVTCTAGANLGNVAGATGGSSSQAAQAVAGRGSLSVCAQPAGLRGDCRVSEAQRRALQEHLSCSPEPRPRRTTSAPVVLQMWRRNASPAARGGQAAAVHIWQRDRQQPCCCTVLWCSDGPAAARGCRYGQATNDLRSAQGPAQSTRPTCSKAQPTGPPCSACLHATHRLMQPSAGCWMDSATLSLTRAAWAGTPAGSMKTAAAAGMHTFALDPPDQVPLRGRLHPNVQ